MFPEWANTQRTISILHIHMPGLPQSEKNIWKMKFFVDGQGNLERTWKVREKSGNLKINGYGRQFSENLFCSRGERMFFEIV